MKSSGVFQFFSSENQKVFLDSETIPSLLVASQKDTHLSQLRPSATGLFLLEQSKVENFDYLETPKPRRMGKQKEPERLKGISSLKNLPMIQGNELSSLEPAIPRIPKKTLKPLQNDERQWRKETTSMTSIQLGKIDRKETPVENYLVQTSRGKPNQSDALSFAQKAKMFLKSFQESPQRGSAVSFEALEKEKSKTQRELAKMKQLLNKIIEKQMEKFGQEQEKHQKHAASTGNQDEELKRNKETIQKLKRDLNARTSNSTIEFLMRKKEALDKESRNIGNKINCMEIEVNEMKKENSKINSTLFGKPTKDSKNSESEKEVGFKEQSVISSEPRKPKTHQLKTKRRSSLVFPNSANSDLETKTIEDEEFMAGRDHELLLEEKMELSKELKELELKAQKEKILRKIEKIKREIQPFLEIDILSQKANELRMKIAEKDEEKTKRQKEFQSIMDMFKGPVKELIKEAFDKITLKQKQEKGENISDRTKGLHVRPKEEKQEKMTGGILQRCLMGAICNNPKLCKVQSKMERFNVITSNFAVLENGGRSQPAAFRLDSENPKGTWEDLQNAPKEETN